MMVRDRNPNQNNVVFNKVVTSDFLKWLDRELKKQEEEEKQKK